MRVRLLIPLLFVAGLLAFGSVVAGCGGGGDEGNGANGGGQAATENGDGGGSLDEYFQQLKALSDDATAQFDAVSEEFPGVFSDPGDTRDALAKLDSVFDDIFARLDDMDPPDEVKQAHNDFRDGVVIQRQAFDKIASAAADAESAPELQQAIEAILPDLDAASSKINGACLALQGIADDNGVVVDLQCAAP
jgi:hypothetical protein